MTTLVGPVLVSIAELAALLEADPGTGVARRRLLLDLELDPQIARLGRGLLAVRAAADSHGEADSVATTLREANSWATLRLDSDTVARVLFAASPTAVAALRIEEGGWVTVEISADQSPYDSEAVELASGAAFEVLDGPAAGRGLAWSGVDTAFRAPHGEWRVSVDPLTDPASALRQALDEFVDSAR